MKSLNTFSFFDPFGVIKFWQEQTETAKKFFVDYHSFMTDFLQRAVLLTDVYIERGKKSVEKHHHFSRYEMEEILSGLNSEVPCNYHLMKIIPSENLVFKKTQDRVVLIGPPRTRKAGIEVTAEKNQASVAWKEGYEVYYLLFDPKPVPGQTVADAVKTVSSYIKYLNKLHPHPEGVILVGNCREGWHSLLCSLDNPNDLELKHTLFVSGTPFSPWSGESGDGSMRFNGIPLGGAWLTALSSDLLGGEVFDGANIAVAFDVGHSIENFLLGNGLRIFNSIDTRRVEFLEMEAWKSGFNQTTKKTMMWTLKNLFIGNKLERGQAELGERLLDMKDHPNLFILFNSLGDNIATVWQCQSWILEVWKDIESLKSSGKTIVIMVHPTTGHLGIFFSGRVAERWYGSILREMIKLEELPPGLFRAIPQEDGSLLVEKMFFSEIPIPNPQGREILEKAAKDSERNLAIYDEFFGSWVRKWISPWTKNVFFHFHPYRLQRYPFLFSDFNPFFVLIKNLTKNVRQNRLPISEPENNFFFQIFKAITDSASKVLKGVEAENTSRNRKLAVQRYDC